MGSSDEFLPEQRIIDRVVEEVIRPTLQAIESDLHMQVCATLAIHVADVVVHTQLVFSDADIQSEKQPDGEIRLRFRRTIKPQRHRWRIGSIFPDISPETGFTGFNAAGDIKLNGSEIVVGRKGWTGKYNVREWAGWI